MEELVKIFCFTKNEAPLMKYWIPYYGQLFGFKNVYLCDHGSNKATQKVYSKYKKHGLNVKDCSSSNFGNKWKILSRLMQEHKKTTKWLIPIDSDEFIVKKVGEVFSTDTKVINDYMEELKVQHSLCRFRNNVAIPKQHEYEEPLLEIDTFCEKSTTTLGSKVFFPGKFFVHTDQGNHNGKLINNENRQLAVMTDLNLLHFDMRGCKQILEKYKRGLKAYEILDKDNEYTGKKATCGSHWFVRWQKIQKHKKRGGGVKSWYDAIIKRRLTNPDSIITQSKVLAETLKRWK